MTKLNINGKPYDVDVAGDTPLLWVLRDELGMTGTKFGCGMALCGACTVHIDGQPGRACVPPVSALANKKVVTIEAIAPGQGRQSRADSLDRQERAAMRLLPVRSDHERDRAAGAEPKPTDADIDAAMTGNICRCGTYGRIRAAIKQAAGDKGAMA